MCYNSIMSKNNLEKENRTIIKHFRVSPEEDRKLDEERKQLDFKDDSKLIRYKLGLDKND